MKEEVKAGVLELREGALKVGTEIVDSVNSVFGTEIGMSFSEKLSVAFSDLVAVFGELLIELLNAITETIKNFI